MPANQAPQDVREEPASRFSPAGDPSGQAIRAGSRRLRPEDELLFPMAKAAVAQYERKGDSPPILRIFHRDREIALGDPAFFPFGEALVRHSRFRAGDALSWGPCGWPKLRRLLERLIEARVLRRADDGEAAPEPLRPDEREPLLAPGPCPRPRTWDECEAIMREISGEPLETGHIELVVPVFRVAHMYLDADDRQIGEANVFPPEMRLDRPTSWRTCTYPGSRYQPELPMNVTALRMMRAHWGQMMAVVRRVSDAYRARFPAVGERGWTIGDIERMTVCVTALPTLLLMRRQGRVENGRLHPALSSAFRLVDGPRTLMRNMVFAPPGEPARADDTPMTGAELHAFAERSDAFRTAHGVCAGPPAMIDDFLAVALDRAEPRGGWPRELDPEVAEALDAVEPAIDYALLGLQAFACVFALVPAASAARAELGRIAGGWRGGDSLFLAALRARLEPGPPGEEEIRRGRLAAYDDMYRKCGGGLAGGPARSPLERCAIRPPLPAATQAALESAFARRLGARPGGDALAAALAASLARFIVFVQAALEAALEAQGRINALLGRQPPARPFTGRDLARNIAIRRPEAAFLVDEIAGLLGIAIDVGAGSVTVEERPRRVSRPQPLPASARRR